MSHNKYSDLHSLHARIRSTQSVNPQSISKRDIAARGFDSIIAQSLGDKLNPPCGTDSLDDKNFSKSSAQVAAMSPAIGADDKPDLAGVVTPCTLAAVKRQRQPKGSGLIQKIYFRVTKAEYEQKSTEAKAYGISISDWARSAFLNHRLPPPRETASAIRNVLLEFSRASTNLNQIAHSAHCGAQVSTDIAIIKAEMLPIIRKFRKLVGLEPP